MMRKKFLRHFLLAFFLVPIHANAFTLIELLAGAKDKCCVSSFGKVLSTTELAAALASVPSNTPARDFVKELCNRSSKMVFALEYPALAQNTQFSSYVQAISGQLYPKTGEVCACKDCK